MKKKIFLLSIIGILASCQNQQQSSQGKQTKKENYLLEIQPIESIKNMDYFIGKWKVYDKQIGSKSVHLNPCNEKSYWEFHKKDNNFFQTKVTATKDCKTFIHRKASKVTYSMGALHYFIDDLEYMIDVQKKDENRFFTSQKEVVSGKNVIIYTFYERL